ncbi:MAG: hypothetical protein CM1200mP29_04860 [Verrucomicrobiota bacterium]|nr:MAG: hypothetical protein CM1200mP29_04860 [Verrucomicrobiota bacterium]
MIGARHERHRNPETPRPRRPLKSRPQSATTLSRTTRRSRSGNRGTCQTTVPRLASTKPDTPLGIYVISRSAASDATSAISGYTDKNSSEIPNYIDAVLDEMQLYAKGVFVGGRKPNFVYFGGGTPSYLSEDQLRHPTDGMKDCCLGRGRGGHFRVRAGTLREKKLEVLREIGVTG